MSRLCHGVLNRISEKSENQPTTTLAAVAAECSPEAQLRSAYHVLLPGRDIDQGAGNPLAIWEKPPVTFMHIPKTGGSTLYFWITQYFHPLQIFPQKEVPYLTKEGLSACKYKLIAGHMQFIESSHLPRMITLLRDPKKRIYSLYYFLKAQSSFHGTNPEIKAAYTNDFGSFLKLQGSFRNGFDNLYLRLLGDAMMTDYSRDDPLLGNEEKILQNAKDSLDKMLGVGILERFNETIHLFCRVLQLEDVDPGAIQPKMVMSNMQENLGTSKLEKIEYAEVDDEAQMLMEQCTRYDQILYDYACSKLSQISVKSG